MTGIIRTRITYPLLAHTQKWDFLHLAIVFGLSMARSIFFVQRFGPLLILIAYLSWARMTSRNKYAHTHAHRHDRKWEKFTVVLLGHVSDRSFSGRRAVVDAKVHLHTTEVHISMKDNDYIFIYLCTRALCRRLARQSEQALSVFDFNFLSD